MRPRTLPRRHTPFLDLTIEPWMAEGRCTEEDRNPDDWFPNRANASNPAAAAHALELCGHCPVAATCLTYAIEYPGYPALVGVWGATTEAQRRRAWRWFHKLTPKRQRHRTRRDT